MVGWGNGVRYGRGTNAARCSKAGHKCAAACALFCADQFFCRRAASVETPAAVRFQSSKKPARCLIDIRDGLKRKLFRMSAILLFVGSVGWCWPVLSELRSLISVSPAAASIHPHVSYCQRLNRCRGKADSEIGKLDPFSSSTYAPSADPHVTPKSDARLGRESPARIVARERSGLRIRGLADAACTERNTRRKSRSRA